MAGFGKLLGWLPTGRGAVTSQHRCRRSDTQITGALCKLGVERLAEGTMFRRFFLNI